MLTSTICTELDAAIFFVRVHTKHALVRFYFDFCTSLKMKERFAIGWAHHVKGKEKCVGGRRSYHDVMVATMYAPRVCLFITYRWSYPIILYYIWGVYPLGVYARMHMCLRSMTRPCAPDCVVAHQVLEAHAHGCHGLLTNIVGNACACMHGRTLALLALYIILIIWYII